MWPRRGPWGTTTRRRCRVGTAWLDAVPAGHPLQPPGVSDIGAPGPSVGNLETVVGQVFAAANVGTTTQYFVMLTDGLAPVTETEAALLIAAEPIAAAYQPRTPRVVSLGAAEATEAPRSVRSVSDPALPGTPPTPPTLSAGELATLCATYADGDVVTVAAGASVPTGTTPAALDNEPDGQADDVVVPPGGGALLGLTPVPGQDPTTTYLLTDAGYRYPSSGHGTGPRRARLRWPRPARGAPQPAATPAARTHARRRVGPYPDRGFGV